MTAISRKPKNGENRRRPAGLQPRGHARLTNAGAVLRSSLARLGKARARTASQDACPHGTAPCSERAQAATPRERAHPRQEAAAANRDPDPGWKPSRDTPVSIPSHWNHRSSCAVATPARAHSSPAATAGGTGTRTAASTRRKATAIPAASRAAARNGPWPDSNTDS